MPRKQDIKVNVTCRIVDTDEESEKILQVVKNFYVQGFTEWYKKQLENKGIC